MSKTQWRRYQRIKKAEQNVMNQPQQNPGPSNFVQVVQKEVVPSTYAQVAQNGKQVDDKPTAPVEDVDSNMITESFESEPKSNSAIFDPPNGFMKNHLRPLFVSGRVNGYFANRMLVDGGAAINTIPKSSLRKLGKTEEDLRPHNIVITDFNGKTSKFEGMIALDIKVGDLREVEADYTQVKANAGLVELDKFLWNVAPLRIEDPSSREEGMYPIYVRLNPESDFVIKYETEYEMALEEIDE
ncbi:Aspartic peptidase domain superfamily [Sesbania bispinosa]|nr:Aspartic peptidase domain superfamily [Sesbania bispinosa]